MIESLPHAPAEIQRRDRKILYGAAFLRALATGMIGVLLGLYLSRLHFSPAEIGLVIGVGLTGGAIATLSVMLMGDRLGRKAFLLLLAILGMIGVAVVALSSDAAVVGVAAFLGMVNGMGRDRGASLVLEQAILPATAPDAERTRSFARYNVLQDIGHALGSLLAGTPALLSYLGVGEIVAFRLTLGIYVFLVFLTLLLYLGLSPAIEVRARRPAFQVSAESRRTLWKISSLFALDSFGGGFVMTSLLSYFFYERFGVGEEIIGMLFFGARAANALSHLGAAWLAKRIGLVNTMVFTHIPSSLLLAAVPFAPSFQVAAILFLLREGLVEMDVPTRQSYVMAVVRSEERNLCLQPHPSRSLGGLGCRPLFRRALYAGALACHPSLHRLRHEGFL
ncbi:MAG: MFS transporter [Candidatus Manganitrophaceae bacterium]|nr:MAG: MFS transporter [Candidatus Manganitrophaceae bacterium]